MLAAAASRDARVLARAAVMGFVLLSAALPAVAATQSPASAPDSAVPNASAAQPDAQPDAFTDCRRCLNGHRFLVSPLVPDPFITTHFRNLTGGGAATDLTVAVRNAEGEVVDSLQGDIAFLAVDFEYQYAATKWLGLYVSANATGRIGTNAEAVIASGATAVGGSSIGAVARVWRGSNAQISLAAEARRNQLWVVDPFGFGQAIANGVPIEDAGALLLRDVSANRFTGGVRGAWAPLPWLGLDASLDAGVSDDPTPDEGSDSVLEYAALLSFDSRTLWRVPLGVTLAYRGLSGAGETSQFAGSAFTYAVGLHYTGRANYVIGLETVVAKVNSETSGASDMKLVGGRLVTRFDF